MRTGLSQCLSVMDDEQTMRVSSRVLDQKQQNIFGRISLFWVLIVLILMGVCVYVEL